MSYGTGSYGELPYGGYGFPGAGPYLVSSSPEDGSSGNAANTTVTFRIDSDVGVDPSTIDVKLDGVQAIQSSVFLTGYSGTIVQDGSAVVVTFTTHPDFTHPTCTCAIHATDASNTSAWMAFAFLVDLDGIADLQAKTWCDGKRIDLSFTIPSGIQRIKIRRSKYAYCQFITDPGEDIYDGEPLDINESATMTRFVDGTFSSATVRTTNKDLSEGTFYYYSIFFSYTKQNYFKYSDQFNNAVWSPGNSTITADAVAGPFPGTFGDALNDNGVNGAHYVQQVGASLTGKTVAVASVYAKAGAKNFLVIAAGGGAVAVWYDLINGTVGVQGGGTGAIVSIGNGWYRCSFSWDPTSVSSPEIINYYAAQVNGNAIYTGTGAAAIYLARAQMHPGSLGLYAETTSIPYLNDLYWIINPDCQVEGLSIKDYYARYGDWVYNLLPRTYRSRDADPNRGTNQYKLRDYCRVIQCAANLQRGWLEGLLLLRDPDNMPAGRLGEAQNQAGILSAQSWDLGMPPERSFDAGVLRRVALGIVPVFKKKGTCTGLVDLVKLFAGWDARCDEQIEPDCGVDRLFTTYDNQSYIIAGVGYAGGGGGNTIIENEGFAIFPNGSVLDIHGNTVHIPLSSNPDPIPSFIIDSLGTFVCVDSVETDLIYGSGGERVNFTKGWAKLRAEITGSGTGALNSFTITSVDFSISPQGGWPWQFPTEEPKFAKDALRDLQLLDSANNKFQIISNTETNSSGDTVLTVTGTPATGAYSVAKDFLLGGSYAARSIFFQAILYIGEFSLTWNPIWDIRLRLEGQEGYWSMLPGFGSSNALGATSTPADVVMWVADIHEAKGIISSATPSSIIDTTQTWTPGQWIGYYLLPNWNQTRLYKIVDNTATELVVYVQGAGLSTITGAGLNYVILSEENAIKYSRLSALLPSFIPYESRGFIKFESVFQPSDLGNLQLEVRSDRGVLFNSYPAVSSWIDQSSHANSLFQFTAGSRPTFLPNYGDGQTAILFDGVDDKFNFTASIPSIGSGSYTIFAVYRCSGVNATNGIFGAGKFASSNPRIQLTVSNTGAQRIDHRDDSLVEAQITPGPSATVGNWHIGMFRRDASQTPKVFTDRLDDLSQTTTASTGTTTVDDFRIGATPQAGVDSNPFGGHIRHILIYDRYLTDAEVAKVLRFLRETWPSI